MRNLEELKKEDACFYGTKAANLGEAIQAGLQVPKGVALSFSYFTEFLSDNNINFFPNQYMAKGLQLQRRILEGTLNPDKRQKLFATLEQRKDKNGCKAYAVRSSSSIEDSNSFSMAGIFESYLKLQTLEEVEEAIKKCYATLYQDRVLNYLYENNISFDKLKMGIIIQEYMEGDSHGILFTADTITMKEHLLQISVTEGDCSEAMNLNASVYNIDKSTGAATTVYDIHSEENEKESGLAQEFRDKLMTLANRVEEHFGVHQDIEWVYQKNKLYLLQVRPITTFKGKPLIPVWDTPEQEAQDWFGIFERPCKPLMQDIQCKDINQQAQGALETLFRTDTHAECKVIQGYLYVRSIPIENEENKRKEYLDRLKELSAKNQCIYHDIILPNLKEYCEKLNSYIGRELSYQEIVTFLKLSTEYMEYCSRQHWPAVQANEFLYSYEKEFLTKFQDKDLQDFYDLVSGFTLLSRERELLLSMAETVNHNEELRSLFDTCPYDAILYERLKNCMGAQHLLSSIETYCKEYGICTEIESEELQPTILERPDLIIGSIRKVLEVDLGVFEENRTIALQKKESIKKEIRDRLQPEEQKEFLRKTELAEKAFLANDNHNYYIEKQYYGYLRLAIMEAGRYLTREELLKEPLDIMFWSIEEIIALLEGTIPEQTLLSIRKSEYETQRQIAAPEVLSGKRSSEELEDALDHHTKLYKYKDKQQIPDSMVLQGVSGLKKTITGTVQKGLPKILTRDAILVLPQCHCGDIIPVISKVKGLIFQWGAPYDHPAIIARELGIPAIYYVNGAMDRLDTGDEVEIDGYSGKVTILSKAKQE